MKRSPIKPTSAKRAAEIKGGAKMSGTFKIKAGAPMSAKVVDRVFGKARKPLRGRKPTGEAKLFKELWEIRRHECVVCGAHIEEAGPINFSHLLPKGSYRSMRLDPRNIHIKCPACHERWHQHGAAGLRYSFLWRNVIRMYDDLKEEYNLRISAQLSGKA